MATTPPPINWGDTTTGDVQAYLDANPPRFSAAWWHNFLFVEDIAAPIQDHFKLGTDPAGDAITAAETGAQQAAAAAAQATGEALGGAASSRWATVAPYLAVGAVAFVAFQALKAR